MDGGRFAGHVRTDSSRRHRRRYRSSTLIIRSSIGPRRVRQNKAYACIFTHVERFNRPTQTFLAEIPTATTVVSEVLSGPDVLPVERELHFHCRLGDGRPSGLETNETRREKDVRRNPHDIVTRRTVKTVRFFRTRRGYSRRLRAYPRNIRRVVVPTKLIDGERPV